jgi:hypothetical protein
VCACVCVRCAVCGALGQNFNDRRAGMKFYPSRFILHISYDPLVLQLIFSSQTVHMKQADIQKNVYTAFVE